MAGGKLTPRQERFVAEYLLEPNGLQAAIRAGYSRHTAKQIGSRLLTDVDVQQAIERKRQVLAVKTEITQERVVAGLLKEAEYFGDDSSHSARVSAWGLLGKHLGMFIERHEVSVNHHLVDRLSEAVERYRQSREIEGSAREVSDSAAS